MQKQFSIQVGLKTFPAGTQPDKYHLAVNGPEQQEADIPYGTTPLEIVLTFNAAGSYTASAVLLDAGGNPLGDPGETTFEIAEPPVSVKVVLGLTASDV